MKRQRLTCTIANGGLCLLDFGLNIIHEDSDLLALNKPAGLVCHPTKGDAMSSLASRVRLYLAGNAAAHLINRLDRETSGITLVAKNPVAAGELGKIWETRGVQKEYLAIVHGHVQQDRQVIDAPLGKDTQSRVVIKDCVRPDGASAQTEFIVERRFVRGGTPFSLLHVHPRTGRKHQIRIHLEYVGHPIVGDKIYGGEEDCYLALVENRLTESQRARLILSNHALHAAAVRFAWRGRDWEFCAPAEAELVSFMETA